MCWCKSNNFCMILIFGKNIIYYGAIFQIQRKKLGFEKIKKRKKSGFKVLAKDYEQTSGHGSQVSSSSQILHNWASNYFHFWLSMHRPALFGANFESCYGKTSSPIWFRYRVLDSWKWKTWHESQWFIGNWYYFLRSWKIRSEASKYMLMMSCKLAGEPWGYFCDKFLFGWKKLASSFAF